MWTQNHNRAKNRENIPGYVFPPITPARQREKERSFGSKSSEGGLERAETRAEGGGVWRDYKGGSCVRKKGLLKRSGNRLLDESWLRKGWLKRTLLLVENEVETG